MIPVKLKLSNFTSYGQDPPELDFTKFHMAAISGPNGAGKSSLLDAITWCVWGSSRLGDTSDSLIRLGQTQMYVEFSFNLDGHVYDVRRVRSKKGGGSTSLELFGGSTGSPLHNLTEGTIKTTQQKIIDILHLTYETFVNSAFLRQGHADEFTTKGPTDRKRILADILGLSHYDVLEEKAREKAKDIQTKLQLLEYQLLEIEAEALQKEEREKDLGLAEKEASETERQLRDVEGQIKLIESGKQLITSKLQSLEEAKSRVGIAQKEMADIKAQIAIKQQATGEFQQILDQKEVIEKNYQQLHLLQTERKTLESRRSELIQIKNELAKIQKILLEREGKRAQVISQLGIEIKSLQTECESLQKQVDHLHSHKDTCPTCGQTIAGARSHEIVTNNNSIIAGNTKKIKQLEQRRQKYQAVVLPEQVQAEEKEKAVADLDRQTSNWTNLTKQLNELDRYSNLYIKLKQADTAVKSHAESIDDLEKILNQKESHISQETAILKDLENYQTQLKEAQKKLEAEEEVKLKLSQKALDARGKVGEVKQLVSRAKQLEELLKKRQQEKAGLTKEKEVFEELSLAFGKKGIQAMIIETAIPEIEAEANTLLDRLTEGRMRVALVTQRETKTLRRSLPRAESRGSRQAGEEKAPGIIETLDIIISDEMGERPYESWSGGEKFRVDLSIRLALSKLLTNRAGSKLQFLVIDEGFGTQDAQGISKIVETINAIQDDFEKILIITHLDELKEEFPVRVEVTKGTTGSTFEVIGV